MKSKSLLLVALLGILVGNAQAALINLAPADSLSTLMPGAAAATEIYVSHVNSATLKAEVLSQAYFDGNNYVYLYQLQIAPGSKPGRRNRVGPEFRCLPQAARI
jgi:hypothetical protein